MIIHVSVVFSICFHDKLNCIPCSGCGHRFLIQIKYKPYREKFKYVCKATFKWFCVFGKEDFFKLFQYDAIVKIYFVPLDNL